MTVRTSTLVPLHCFNEFQNKMTVQVCTGTSTVPVPESCVQLLCTNNNCLRSNTRVLVRTISTGYQIRTNGRTELKVRYKYIVLVMTLQQRHFP